MICVQTKRHDIHKANLDDDTAWLQCCVGEQNLLSAMLLRRDRLMESRLTAAVETVVQDTVGIGQSP